MVLILRCSEGEGADAVLDTMEWDNVVYLLFGSGVLPDRGPWWLNKYYTKTNVYLTPKSNVFIWKIYTRIFL